MSKPPVLLLAVCLAIAPAVGAQICEVCVPTGDAAESAALMASLTAIGFSTTVADNPVGTACNVYMTYPGSSWASVAAWVQAGNGLVQISDWGPDIQANTFLNVGGGNPPQTVTVVDGGHPIVAGVAATWQTFGFWHYAITDDYIGWVTAADPNIAQISGNDRGLSARAEGSGNVVYIGWNVYGADASADDLTVLQQAIEWAGNCVVPVELMSFTVE